MSSQDIPKHSTQDTIAAAMDRELREGTRIARAAEARYADPQRHLVHSHADWTRIVHAAGLNAIPSWQCATLDKADLLAAWDDDTGAQGRPREAQAQIDRHADTMEHRIGRAVTIRCDFCAPSRTKQICAYGEEHKQIAGAHAREARYALTSDMRVAELLGEWPRAQVPVHLRPYEAPTMDDGWPVELRVWVWDATVRAVANYYPQRSLEGYAGIDAMIADAIEQTERLVAKTPKFDPLPYRPDIEPEAITFTADFIASARGETLWLECGPYTFPASGAHPCAIDDPRRLWEPHATPLIVVTDVKRHRATAKHRQATATAQC